MSVPTVSVEGSAGEQAASVSKYSDFSEDAMKSIANRYVQESSKYMEVLDRSMSADMWGRAMADHHVSKASIDDSIKEIARHGASASFDADGAQRAIVETFRQMSAAWLSCNNGLSLQSKALAQHVHEKAFSGPDASEPKMMFLTASIVHRQELSLFIKDNGLSDRLGLTSEEDAVLKSSYSRDEGLVSTLKAVVLATDAIEVKDQSVIDYNAHGATKGALWPSTDMPAMTKALSDTIIAGMPGISPQMAEQIASKALVDYKTLYEVMHDNRVKGVVSFPNLQKYAIILGIAPAAFDAIASKTLGPTDPSSPWSSLLLGLKSLSSTLANKAFTDAAKDPKPESEKLKEFDFEYFRTVALTLTASSVSGAISTMELMGMGEDDIRKAIKSVDVTAVLFAHIFKAVSEHGSMADAIGGISEVLSLFAAFSGNDAEWTGIYDKVKGFTVSTVSTPPPPGTPSLQTSPVAPPPAPSAA